MKTELRMQDFIEELKELEENIVLRQPPKEGVVMYGSSSFRLWGAQVNEDLKRDDIANLAFGGSTLRACAFYFEQIVVPYQPKSILLYAGDNDLGNGATAEEVFSYFQLIITKIRRHFPTIPVTFVSAKPSPSRVAMLPQIVKLNALVKAEIDVLENVFYIDVFSKMLLPNGEVDAALFIEDQLHMNAAGYKIWTETILAFKDQIFHS